MKDILAHPHRSIIARHVTHDSLLAFDFDGTLAPISPLRDDVEMRPRTRDLLTQLCGQHRCAIVTGRARSDVLERLRGVPVHHVIGNHGIEPSPDEAKFEAWALRTRSVLERPLSHVRGVELEHKRFSLTIHYRAAPVQAQAMHAIEAAMSLLDEPCRVVGGKCVVNLLPEGAPHKGSALRALAQAERAQRVVYVGDDDTDEDVFVNADAEHLLGIRVGKNASSAAPYYLCDQAQIDQLLEMLLATNLASAANQS